MIFKNRGENRNHKAQDFLNTKIELICSDDDLRPAMNCVYFKDGFLYATNALVAVKQALHLHGINEEVAKHLDGKMLHKSHLKLMKKCDCFQIVEGGIKSKKGMIEMVHLFTNDERYPDVESVIPRTGFAELESITVNASLMNQLQSVMFMVLDNTYKFLNVKFKGKNKVMVVTTNVPENDQVAIMMPVYGKD